MVLGHSFWIGLNWVGWMRRGGIPLDDLFEFLFIFTIFSCVALRGGHFF